jgi:hypothetical protein
MNWQMVVAFLQANWQFLEAHWQTVVAFLQALLTPTIAVLTVVIAVAQYRLAKAQFRHELYERRSAVYKATMKFIAQVTSSGPDIAEAHTFLRDTSEVPFLFKGKRIPDFLKKLYEEVVDLHTTDELLKSRQVTQAQLEERAEKAGKLRLWFGQQFDECRRLFAKDLSLV